MVGCDALSLLVRLKIDRVDVLRGNYWNNRITWFRHRLYLHVSDKTTITALACLDDGGARSCTPYRQRRGNYRAKSLLSNNRNTKTAHMVKKRPSLRRLHTLAECRKKKVQQKFEKVDKVEIENIRNLS
jgi:hypothetical protein